MTRLLALLLSLVAFARSAGAYEVEPLHASGDPAVRIDLVILGDGYRDVDQAKLSSDARTFSDRLFATPPFDRYRDYFNVSVVHVVSNQDGADNGSLGAARDTALGAFFNCGGIDRLLCVDDAAVFGVAAADAPDFDQLFVVVNDGKYGGAGGQVGTFSTNELAADIAIHELGHTFANLADEYEDAYPGFPGCDASGCPEPNATNQTDRALVPWQAWIDPATPVPTPEDGTYAAKVGLFQGARYQASGVYRPVQSCMMRELGAPLCDVCREALVLATYARMSPIESAAPAGDVAVASCAQETLSITRLTPAPDDLDVSWWVDGELVQEGGDALAVGPELGVGAHTVVARVHDTTTFVRTDDASLTMGEHTWNVDVQRGTADGDADGLVDCDDNCSEAANQDQLDADADGTGDACDGDDDGDGVEDQQEALGDLTGGCAAAPAGAPSALPLLLLALALAARRRRRA